MKKKMNNSSPTREIVDIALKAAEENNLDVLEDIVKKMLKNHNNSAISHLFSANLNNLKNDKKKTQEAFEKSLEIAPNYGEAHRQFAEFLRVNGYVKEAIYHAKTSNQLNKNQASSYDTLGNALVANNNFHEALESYEKGLKIDPNLTQMINNLGNAYRNTQQLQKSIQCFKKCIAINPDQPIYYTNLALTYFKMEKYNLALNYVRKANDLEKNNSHVYAVSGHILTKLHKFTDAEKSYMHAIKINSNYSMAYNGLANVQKLLGKPKECLDSLSSALKNSSQIESDYSNILMVKNYLLNNSYKQAFLEARKFEDLNFDKKSINTIFENSKEKERKIILGFVSGDYYEHPVGYFLHNLLSNINKNKFTIYGYYNNQLIDEQSKLLINDFDFFRNISDVSTESAFRQIQEDKIDILFDLSGHTARNSLKVFRKKPSPIQISWLGYCFTTGLSSIDYILCDNVVLPKNNEKWFIEKPIRMSKSYYCFSEPRYDSINIEEKKENKDFFIFGCFSNSPKINKAVIETWSKILNETKLSKIMLKAKSFTDPQGYEWVLDKFQDTGIDKSRIIFEGISLREDYLRTYNKINITLDTFPYPGGTTSCESLFMGVPVITLKGNNFLGNNGNSILSNSGLEEYISESVEEYIEKAIFCYKNRKKLNLKSKLKLREKFRNSAIVDGKSFSKEFEMNLLKVWNKWCNE